MAAAGLQRKPHYESLPVVTTLFLPLTLIVGWYGMNFKYMPELSALRISRGLYTEHISRCVKSVSSRKSACYRIGTVVLGDCHRAMYVDRKTTKFFSRSKPGADQKTLSILKNGYISENSCFFTGSMSYTVDFESGGQ
jgi:hypothetical protein